MNRKYSPEKYQEIVNILREKVKDVSITTDVIVGFPGETEEEFNETYEFLKAVKLTKLHVFKFSPRKGTKAAAMKEQIPGDIKEYRSHKLLELSDFNEKEFGESLVGREMPVLFEKEQQGASAIFEGYTPNYLKIVVQYDKGDLVGKIAKVKITQWLAEHGIGIIVE